MFFLCCGAQTCSQCLRGGHIAQSRQPLPSSSCKQWASRAWFTLFSSLFVTISTSLSFSLMVFCIFLVSISVILLLYEHAVLLFTSVLQYLGQKPVTMTNTFGSVAFCNCLIIMSGMFSIREWFICIYTIVVVFLTQCGHFRPISTSSQWPQYSVLHSWPSSVCSFTQIFFLKSFL